MGGEMRRFRGEYQDPMSTKAFQDEMRLAGERTGAGVSEAQRGGREAASRAGFTGGFNARGEESAIARQEVLAAGGLQAAGQARQQALEGYTSAAGNFSSLVGGYNQNVTQTNIAQAELDEAFNKDQISLAQYRNMSASVAAGLALGQAKLNEQSREFDVGAGQWEKGFGEKQREFDVGTGQWEKGFGEQKRRFDVGAGQFQQQFGESKRQFDKSLAEKHWEVSQASGRDKSLLEERLKQQKYEFDKQFGLSKEQSAREFKEKQRQFDSAYKQSQQGRTGFDAYGEPRSDRLRYPALQ
jgi:hypothetical protein